MRYADTASRRFNDTVHAWLAGILPSATAFACQSGYYRYEALERFSADVERMLQSGGRFDLVIGANEDRLSGPDLEKTLDLVGAYVPENASFTLVGASNGLFHPKVYYVELGDGTRHAAIGSANFTGSGIGHNIEACLLLEDSVDDPSTLDAARDAIYAWRKKAAAGSPDARAVTPEYIQQLEAERIVEPIPVPPTRSGGASTKTGRSSFPALKRIPGVPKPKARPAPEKPAPGVKLGGAPLALPANAVGIVKRLSPRTDVKGFVGTSGTPYISLPPAEADLANRLPMKPYGRNQEPRVDVKIEARLLEVVRQVVTSGRDTTNITYVGMGQPRRSKIDLRFNVHHAIMDGLRYVAAQEGLTLPQGGDFVAIEMSEGGRLLRLTFVTSGPMKQTLAKLLIPNRAWGWLPAGVMPEW